MTVGALDNVRYLGEFGEYRLTVSFSACDPKQTSEAVAGGGPARAASEPEVNGGRRTVGARVIVRRYLVDCLKP